MGLVTATHRLQAQQITAVAIGHGKGINLDAVAGQKPTLEIHTPDIVCSLARTQRMTHARRANPAFAGPNQAGPDELPAHGRGRGPGPLRRRPIQISLDLVRTPSRIAQTHRDNRLDHRPGHGGRVAKGGSRRRLKTNKARLAIACQPFVARLPADPELPAQGTNLSAPSR